MDTTDGDGKPRALLQAPLLRVLGYLFVLPDVRRSVGKNIRPCLEVTSPITFNYYCCKIEGDFY